MADCVGDCPSHRGRSQVHDDVREFEHSFREALEEAKQWTALRRGQHAQSERKNYCEHYNLQHLSFGHRLGDVLRKNVQNQIARTLLLRDRRHNYLIGGSAYTNTGLADVDCSQSNHQCESRDYLEVDQALYAHAPHLF